MKIKSFLIMVLSLISLTVAAQNGGIKGKVVSRATRTATPSLHRSRNGR